MVDLNQRCPNVNIDLVEHLSEDTIKAVLDGNADIGLIAGPIDVRGLETIFYGEDELIFITPPDHPLLEASHTSLANAISYDMVSVGRATSNFQYLLNFARNIGITPPGPGPRPLIRCCDPVCPRRRRDRLGSAIRGGTRHRIRQHRVRADR